MSKEPVQRDLGYPYRSADSGSRDIFHQYMSNRADKALEATVPLDLNYPAAHLTVSNVNPIPSTFRPKDRPLVDEDFTDSIKPVK